jgi:DNA-binding transcriptional LysR family regulator
MSDALRRLEARLGVRLLHRTTRSMALTEAGARLFERLSPALSEIRDALDVVNIFRDRPAGTLRLNVPANVARTVLPSILPSFLRVYPDIRVEVTVEDGFVDILKSGADAGIRYEERLEQDMIAIPIGPATQRLVTAGSSAYFDHHGRPSHPQQLLGHNCLRGRFSGGAMPGWEFEREGEILVVDPTGPLVVQPGLAGELLIDSAVAGLGIVHLFEDWLKPYIASGALESVLDDWCQTFSGPRLYYSGRRYLPAPLRAFVDFVRLQRW